MPISIQVLEGVFSPQAGDELASHLTDAILSINGASYNLLVRRHLIMPGSHMPADKLCAAGKPDPFVNVALRVPTLSLNTPEKRRAFVTTMTDAIEKAAASRLERDRIYINILDGDVALVRRCRRRLDGFWGVGGKAYSDEELPKVLKSAGDELSSAEVDWNPSRLRRSISFRSFCGHRRHKDSRYFENSGAAAGENYS